MNIKRLQGIDSANQADLQPTANELTAAPRLECWRIVAFNDASRLRGEVSGHPLLYDQRITTSALLVLNEAEKWARTRSRFYVLGKPAFTPPTELEVARCKKRLAELSKRVLHHQLYELTEYPTIARVVARRSTVTKLDGRSILAVMETAHPIDLAAMTELERELIDLLRGRQNGVAF